MTAGVDAAAEVAGVKGEGGLDAVAEVVEVLLVAPRPKVE
jgi:hypothetical protein